MKNNKKKKLNEDALRSLLRREITKILEAEEVDTDSQEDSEEMEDEEGVSSEVESATQLFIRKIKDTTGGVESDDLVEIISNIINAFTDSSEHRMSILKGVKSNIVR